MGLRVLCGGSLVCGLLEGKRPYIANQKAAFRDVKDGLLQGIEPQCLMAAASGWPAAAAVLFDSFVEFGSRLELCNLLGGYLYLLFCCRVDAFACRTLVYAERAEANQRNLVACYEGVLDGSHSSVESLLSVGF